MGAPREQLHIDGADYPVHSVNTLVIGSGAAGLNAALQLARRGVRDVVLLTERFEAGASRNAGSDKQTYYKLSLAGGAPDSPRAMAEDLFRGGCMHGDHALCEAQHSAQAFFGLVQLGVAFPHDRFGGYAGFRTDHDERGRGTSAGPLTSRSMCERLEAALRAEGVAVLDRHQAIALLTRQVEGERQVCGAVALHESELDGDNLGLVLVNARNTVLATGGPGGMYRDSVYPPSQHGATGLGLAAGAAANNLSESQFGLASVGFRWNLSGSYQQVVPRYVSTDAQGGDEREFLHEVFADLGAMATAIFRKGYEWPFDGEKILGGGSSLIDLCVHRERVQRGRRVFLDFRSNPTDPRGQCEFSLDCVEPEAAEYLRRSDAWRDTPIERLDAMNRPAIELFADHGTDLWSEQLEIAVCAQHSNGGLAVDAWWRTSLGGLFAIGEVAGTHGVKRPGGAALNAGQVGGLRAATWIAARCDEPPVEAGEFAELAGPQVRRLVERARAMLASDSELRPSAVMAEIQERMSAAAAQIRPPERVEAECFAARELLERLDELRVKTPRGLPLAFRALDLALTHAVYLEAIAESLSAGVRSRGSALVLDPRGELPGAGLEDLRFARTPPELVAGTWILETRLDEGGAITHQWVEPRPIPEEHTWFEAVWKQYMDDRVIR